MSNFAAIILCHCGNAKSRIYNTSMIINGFSNTDYAFLEVSVEFCI
jgi:hypothetical protein